jgi:hypothetical protein
MSRFGRRNATFSIRAPSIDQGVDDKVRFTGTLLLAAILILVFHPTEAHALKCKQLPSVEVKYEKYDGIILAHVEDIVQTEEYRQVDLKVLNSFKAIDDRTLTIYEDANWGPSNLEEENLYYLLQTDRGWENPICSPTERVDYAKEDLEFLTNKEISLQPPPTPIIVTTKVTQQVQQVVEEPEISPQSTRSSPYWWYLTGAASLLLLLGYGFRRLLTRNK